jgi:hypothetical protein
MVVLMQSVQSLEFCRVVLAECASAQKLNIAELSKILRGVNDEPSPDNIVSVVTYLVIVLACGRCYGGNGGEVKSQLSATSSMTWLSPKTKSWQTRLIHSSQDHLASSSTDQIKTTSAVFTV